MRKTKQQLLAIYQAAGEKARLQRELAFVDKQKLGDIPDNLQYSDELYADYIGLEANQQATPALMNEYLTHIQNRLAKIEFKRIFGARFEIFTRDLQEHVPSGDSIEIQYTDIGDVGHYEVSKYIPDATKGGDLVQSQPARLSAIPEAGKKIGDVTYYNPDRTLVDKVVPKPLIMQAMLYAITSGMANGWPTIIEEQMQRTWYRWMFQRAVELIRRFGFTPKNPEWMDPDNVWTPNPGSFIEIPVDVTDEKTFKDFITTVYDTSAMLEGSYHKEYNPAGIDQITPMERQSLFLHSDLQAFWRTTNSIIYNSEIIDVKQQYKRVEFLKLLQTMDNKDVLGVLYTDNPIEHHPFTKGIERDTNTFARNLTIAIYDHFWLLSVINLSKPVIVFTKKKTEEKEEEKQDA